MVRRKSKSVYRRKSKSATETLVSNLPKKQVNRKLRALKEIKLLQRTTNNIIPKACFVRVVREIMMDFTCDKEVNRIQVSALEALQEAFEIYMTQFFSDAYLITLHSKRVTLMRPDILLLRRLRGREDIINH